MRWLWIALLACLPGALAAEGQDVPFLESPDYIVEAMIEMADVEKDDVVYDLGSGDGRILFAAAAAHGCKAVGIEIDGELVSLSKATAVGAGLDGLVTFRQGDIFEADFSEATVVMIYLWKEVNRRLKPHLLEQLAPGTRIVSHRFPIPGWKAIEEDKIGGRWLYLYEIGKSEHGPF